MSRGSGGNTQRKLTGPLRLDAAIGNATLARGEKAILHAIGRNVNFETWTCFPSIVTIAKSAGYSERQTSEIVRRLHEKNILHFDRKSRGGRAGDGRGITHVYRLDIDMLESLINPEGIAGFTSKRGRVNPEPNENEPRGQCEQTDHPSHQSNRPFTAAPEPGKESASAAWMDGHDSPDLRAELMRQGIAGPNLDALVASGRLTVAQVRAEATSVDAAPGVRNKAAVLAKRLLRIAGIESARQRTLARDIDPVVGRIEQLRRSKVRDS
ncbi:MAG: hypothetical protein KF838_06060 [Phycisphaeraceae bacterium]|nr:MAG: hypothetical protein KF838_06060 [Phycisphaeraceae bacterium]